MFSSISGGVDEPDIGKDLETIEKHQKRNKKKKNEHNSVPLLEIGLLKPDQFRLESKEQHKEFEYDIDGIIGSLGEKAEFPNLEDVDEKKRREFELRVMESVSPFVPWNPDNVEEEISFIFSFGEICSNLFLLSKIISFCELKQIISSFFVVNRSFYESSKTHLKTMKFDRKDIKLLFGITSCVSEELFLYLLPGLDQRVETMYLETSIRTGNIKSEILHFCLLHNFRKAAKLLLIHNNDASSHLPFVPHKNEISVAIYGFNDETLLDMMKSDEQKKAQVQSNIVRCFTYRRNVSGLQYFREEYHEKRKYLILSKKMPSDLTTEPYFKHHILLNDQHHHSQPEEVETSVRILEELTKLGYLDLTTYSKDFLHLLPLLPEKIILFFITAKPPNPLDDSNKNKYYNNYVFISDEKDVEKLILGIDVSQTLSKVEKKRLVDLMFYTALKKKHSNRGNDLEHARCQMLIRNIKNSFEKGLDYMKIIADEEETEGEDDVYENGMTRVPPTPPPLPDGTELFKAKAENNIDSNPHILRLKLDGVITGYQFVYFYGRQGYKKQFVEALKFIDLKKVILRQFTPRGIPEELLSIGVESKKIVLVRPMDLMNSVRNKENQEFDVLFGGDGSRVKIRSSSGSRKKKKKKKKKVMMMKKKLNFVFIKEIMQKDMDELLKICILVSNNHAFQRIMCELKTYRLGLPPLKFAISNENSVDVVSYLAVRYCEEENYSDVNRNENLTSQERTNLRNVRISNVICDAIGTGGSNSNQLERYLSLVVTFLREDGFVPSIRFFTRIEDYKLTKKKHVVDTIYKEYRPVKMKRLHDILIGFINRRHRRCFNLLREKWPGWNDSYLLLLRYERRNQLINDLEETVDSKRYLKRECFVVGCFHCGRKLNVLDKSCSWGNHFNACKNCSPTKNSLLEMDLPVNTRDIERGFYCVQCCRNRVVNGINGMYCIICAN